MTFQAGVSKTRSKTMAAAMAPAQAVASGVMGGMQYVRSLAASAVSFSGALARGVSFSSAIVFTAGLAKMVVKPLQALAAYLATALGIIRISWYGPNIVLVPAEARSGLVGLDRRFGKVATDSSQIITAIRSERRMFVVLYEQRIMA